MKTVNKILTYVVSVMLVILIAMSLMRGEWLDAILLSALLMAEWIIGKQSELIEKVRKIGEELGVQVIDLTTKNGNLEKEKTELIGKLADADRENHCLRKDLAEAKKREAIAHKTIEDQRKENYDLAQTITALENQLAALDAHNKTLRYKLSRKPNKAKPHTNE